LRAISRYAAIARQSLRENEPAFYSQLETQGQLETFLAKRAQQAQDMATDIHQRNLAAGVAPGTSAVEADSWAIRDNLLFPSQEEQERKQGVS
jgi:Transposon-encoded protein TnpV